MDHWFWVPANRLSAQRHYTAPTWAIVDRVGYKDIVENLNDKGVHHLENILTLDMVVHDKLRLWFEPTVSIRLFYVKRTSYMYTESWHDIRLSSVDARRL